MNKKLKILALSLLIPALMGATYIGVGKLFSVLSGGQERVERAKILCQSGATVSSQSGSWVNTVTYNGAGDCTLNLPSGIFSLAPTCSCTSGDGATRYCSQTTTTATSVRFNNIVNAAAGDGTIQIICMGPR